MDTPTKNTRDRVPFPLARDVIENALKEATERLDALPPTPEVRSLELRADQLTRELRTIANAPADRVRVFVDAATALESEVATLWRASGRKIPGSTLLPNHR